MYLDARLRSGAGGLHRVVLMVFPIAEHEDGLACLALRIETLFAQLDRRPQRCALCRNQVCGNSVQKQQQRPVNPRVALA